MKTDPKGDGIVLIVFIAKPNVTLNRFAKTFFMHEKTSCCSATIFSIEIFRFRSVQFLN